MNTMSKVAALVLFALFAVAGCRQSGGMMMMGNDQMMEQMRKNPETMRTMMSQMMSDPKMMQQMTDQMMKDPEQCAQMMGGMMKDPKACMLMSDQMAKNPEQCRNMMKAMGDRMDPASAQQMLQHCDTMMKQSGNKPAASASTPVSIPASTSAAVQDLTVNVSGGFSPESLTVKKGQPVRIHFKRDDQPTCIEEVVFPELNIRKKVPANQTTTVEITPTREGTLTFACGMNMMKGKLVVQ